MDEEVLKCQPKSRKRKGTPKLTWMDGIQSAKCMMVQNGLIEEDWEELANEDPLSFI